MLGLTWLDWVLLVVLLVFLLAGYRRGFWVTLGTIVGLVAGAAAAFFSIPLVSDWVPDPSWRLIAIIVAALVLVLIGQAVGAGIGRAIRLRVALPALRTADRLAGAVVNTAVAAGLIAFVAFSASSMGLPPVTSAISQSRVITVINAGVPESAKTIIAQVRATVAGSDVVPELEEPIVRATPTADPTAPEPDNAIDLARASVVRISGTAFVCGQNQTGSGFAVTGDRVVTNAHVVSGLTEPAVEDAEGTVYAGRVVHFDAARDLAVVAVDDADLPTLDTGAQMTDGDSGYIMGYPAGGPFWMGPAEVQARGEVTVNNIYGGDPGPLDIYQLNADVQLGSSGGPLLDDAGDVAGVVFARAAGDVKVGYAITGEEAEAVLTGAGQMEETVSTGQCIQGG
ncbi:MULTISPECIES: MarP family serine protease [Citricoccus]|uniref:MarP family serine protease n=1 Tax=Citricoccus TaxID=169133 RepID=UPI0004900FD5|nr:MarP family serine protease [Citricoccus sp. CH26A]